MSSSSSFEPKPAVDHFTAPRHVAIVMDGNGRWATKRGLHKVDGHKVGAQAAKDLIPHAKKMGIEYLTLFTFSKENWGRDEDEVQGILSLIMQELKNSQQNLDELQVRFKVIGSLEDFPEDMVEEIKSLELKSQNNKDLTVIFALSYGARQDIAAATKAIAQKVSEGALSPTDITEETVASFLSTGGIPEPELFIRSSGELRLSNFLLWELAYAELYFTTCLWPDFTSDHLKAAVESYALRQRCFGKSRKLKAI